MEDSLERPYSRTPVYPNTWTQKKKTCQVDFPDGLIIYSGELTCVCSTRLSLSARCWRWSHNLRHRWIVWLSRTCPWCRGYPKATQRIWTTAFQRPQELEASVSGKEARLLGPGTGRPLVGTVTSAKTADSRCPSRLAWQTTGSLWENVLPALGREQKVHPLTV